MVFEEVIKKHPDLFDVYSRWSNNRRYSVDAWATHLPILLEVFKRSDGRVLELGCGYYSTPQLHYLCEANGRELVSLDSKVDWVEKFVQYRTSWHTIECWTDLDTYHWNNCYWLDQKWGMAFVDNAPGESRASNIIKLKDNTHHIVVHDSECPDYKYEPVFMQFKFRYDFKDFATRSTVLSNFKQFKL